MSTIVENLRDKYADKYRVEIPGHGFVVVKASDQSTALKRATKELGVRPDVVKRLDQQGKVKVVSEDTLKETSAEKLQRYKAAAKFDKKRQELGKKHLEKQRDAGDWDKAGGSYRKISSKVLDDTVDRIDKRNKGLARANKQLKRMEEETIEEKSLLPKRFKDVARRAKDKRKIDKAGELSNKLIGRGVDAEDEGDHEKAAKMTDAGRRATRLKYRLQKAQDKGRRKLPEDYKIDGALEAIKAAKAAAKKMKDKGASVDIYKHKDGKFSINHSDNSAGAQANIRAGAKKVNSFTHKGVKLDELTDREREMIKQRREINKRRGGGDKTKKAKPAPKSSTTVSNTNRVTKTADEDKHIVMQLRKAQDLGGNHDIKFRRGAEKLDRGTINTLLKIHDALKKPDSKRMFRVAVTQSAASARALASKMKDKV